VREWLYGVAGGVSGVALMASYSTKALRTFPMVLGSALLNGCYIEGGGCNGPFCFGVSTEVCGNGVFCEDTDGFERCPDADDIERESVELINRVRSNLTSCSVVQSQFTQGVSWDEQLFPAADLHSRDMASNNFIDALGSDGLGVRDRLGEPDILTITQSVAGGFANTNGLITAWQRDNQECSKLSNQRVTRIALACRYDGNSDFGKYWTLVMAGE